jgi:hypothetical protein
VHLAQFIHSQRRRNKLQTVVDLEIVTAIQRAIDSITDEALLREGSKMPDSRSDDIVIGTCHDGTLKRMWLAARRLKAESKMLMSRSDLVDSNEEELDLMQQARRKRLQAEICGLMFNHQVELQMPFNLAGGEPEFRKDWLCVQTSKGSRPGGVLGAIISQIEGAGGGCDGCE